MAISPEEKGLKGMGDEAWKQVELVVELAGELSSEMDRFRFIAIVACVCFRKFGVGQIAG